MPLKGIPLVSGSYVGKILLAELDGVQECEIPGMVHGHQESELFAKGVEEHVKPVAFLFTALPTLATGSVKFCACVFLLQTK